MSNSNAAMTNSNDITVLVQSTMKGLSYISIYLIYVIFLMHLLLILLFLDADCHSYVILLKFVISGNR